MRNSTHLSGLGCLLAALLLLPVFAGAQTRAGISGTITDESGAVLPGVKVVATSPALIEQSRTVVTDGAGNYRLVSLPPGTYSVIFTLDGFNSVVREGVELQGAFVANVDAALPVGSFEETMTVSGDAVAVDVVNTHQQTVLKAERLEALPEYPNLSFSAAYVPGVVFEGGSLEPPTVSGSDATDTVTYVDGFESGQQLVGAGTFPGGIGLFTMQGAVEELVYDTAAQGSEHAQSGVRMNLVTKVGGNRLSGDLVLYGTGENLESDNLSQEQKNQGFEFAPIDFDRYANLALGGPIKKDKLWWFGSVYYNEFDEFLLDTFFNPDEPSTPEGKGGQRANQPREAHQEQIRISHQVTPRHTLKYGYQTYELDGDFTYLDTLRMQPEASYTTRGRPTYLADLKWTGIMTDRLLFEAGLAYARADVILGEQPANPPDRIPLLDVGTGRLTGTTFVRSEEESRRRMANASVSYVTGSHALKAGLNYFRGVQNSRSPLNGDIQFAILFNGFPLFLNVTPGPSPSERRIDCDCGVYVQDTWTLDRLTMTLGLRYDWFETSIPGGTRPAGFWTPEITIAEVSDTPDWDDVSPRFGAAFDLFGNGKTALKVSAGRYVAKKALGVTDPFNPLALQTDTRTWFDLDGNGTALNPDGTPQFGEIGPSFNPAFGTISTANRLDPDAPRGSNWQFTAGIEHQLRPRVVLSGTFFYGEYSDFTWVDNLEVDADDYVELPYVGPIDPSLPNGGGENITLYHLRQGFVFSAGNLLTREAPDDYRTYTGFEAKAEVQLPRGGFLLASFTTGKDKTHFCQVAQDDPNLLRFCHQEEPFRHQFKLTAAVPLPWNTMISGSFQIYPGSSTEANTTVTPAAVGQPIRTPSGSIPVNLLEPHTRFNDDSETFSLRISKTFNLPRDLELTTYVDAANVFNSSGVLAVNEAFGPNWLRPVRIERGRRISLGLRLSL